jgi:hypothetical protein
MPARHYGFCSCSAASSLHRVRRIPRIVATDVVRALVGSIGLVASVPVSTWLATLVVQRSTGRRSNPSQAPNSTNPRPPV